MHFFFRLDDQAKELLGEAIKGTMNLIVLNLYNCDLRDNGGVFIFNAMLDNDSIEELNVGHNQLSTETAGPLMKFLISNDRIKKLYLHWNLFYPQKAASIKICKGLQKNKSIEVLDLSWNGLIGENFTKSLIVAMRRCKTLTCLNLEYNCLTQENIQTIITSLRVARGLEELYLGMNFFWEEDDIIDAIGALKSHPNLKLLSVGKYTYVSDEVMRAIEDLKRTFPEKEVIYYDKMMPNPPDPVDFQAIVIDRCKFLAMKPKKKRLRKDMGHFMHQLLETEREYMAPSEFAEVLQGFKAKIDDDLKNHLQEVFTQKIKIGKKKGKKVFVKEMADYYLGRHPTEPPPPPKPKKERKPKKGKKKK